MGKSTISMAIQNSFLHVYQRVSWLLTPITMVHHAYNILQLQIRGVINQLLTGWLHIVGKPQEHMGNPRTKWRCIAGKLIELIDGFSSKPFLIDGGYLPRFSNVFQQCAEYVSKVSKMLQYFPMGLNVVSQKISNTANREY